MPAYDEWIETDGAGGYAMGTAALENTRRYHGLLVHARKPPVDRVVLVNDVEIVLERGGELFRRTEVTGCCHDPAPCWKLHFADGSIVEQQFRLCRKPSMAVLQWCMVGGSPGGRLRVRPLLTGREFHALHFRNDACDLNPHGIAHGVMWKLYKGIPPISAVSNGTYEHDPQWRTGMFYREEERRGFECYEDYASPGTFVLDLDQAPMLAFSAGAAPAANAGDALDAVAKAVRRSDRRRVRLGTPCDRAADAYFVRRGKGRSIIAGYPWFNDWGRDTMIALRGLGIARGERKLSRDVLLTWGEALNKGMLPNCFSDDGRPSYNAMDAPLWFVMAAYEFLTPEGAEFPARVPGARRLVRAIEGVLNAYATGTRHGIRADDDGLINGGSPQTNLTWMDAKVGDEAVTPRNGKPVEINALWVNALWIGGHLDAAWSSLHDIALKSFQQRFWLDDGYLADVIDGESGTIDESFRPNQIFAVGGLPLTLIPRQQAIYLVDAVERRLYTPGGLRTLAADDPRYCGRYEGGPEQRDRAYHQGTAWPWLLGPFVEAWLRVRNFSDTAIAEANERFMMPWMAHVGRGGFGHVSEISDGDPPHAARGCPFQAWSLGELIRIQALLNNPGLQRTHWAKADAR